jgi:hypothetical protein
VEELRAKPTHVTTQAPEFVPTCVVVGNDTCEALKHLKLLLHNEKFWH